MDTPAYLSRPLYELPFVHQIEKIPVVWKFEFSGFVPCADPLPIQTEHTRFMTASNNGVAAFAVYNRVDNTAEIYDFWKCGCGRKTIFSPCYCGKWRPK